MVTTTKADYFNFTLLPLPYIFSKEHQYKWEELAWGPVGGHSVQIMMQALILKKLQTFKPTSHNIAGIAIKILYMVQKANPRAINTFKCIGLVYR